MIRLIRFIALCLACLAVPAQSASPLGNARLDLAANARFPLYTSADWTQPQPEVTQAWVLVHGLDRNAKGYFEIGTTLAEKIGTGSSAFWVAPQFLNQDDAPQEPPLLYWHKASWEEGRPAVNADVSAYAVIDAILRKFADRQIFPNLKQIILIGHSGGAQLVQRYAVVGQEIVRMEAAGVQLRYIVANPSSYLYLTENRPFPVDSAACPEFNNWKYGWHKPIAYVENKPLKTMQRRYLLSDVLILLGTKDNDPNHAQLDRRCGAMAQGANRYERGHAYARHLLNLASEEMPAERALKIRARDIPEVAHHARKMLTSPRGIAAIKGELD